MPSKPKRPSRVVKGKPAAAKPKAAGKGVQSTATKSKRRG